ncbi:MAG TPA: single-stranded-DNA-specific exonuclease RecJ [Candidatus Limnocylindrales bacterium]|nr:single-stranded-DNA-specific exonuclease RecJ [Candidatus Limnocylindrales bacterium]HEX5041034.1 single-stranded-DNA-specific exonuclease RecJ [Candidatus Limnocylindria bacterium]
MIVPSLEWVLPEPVPDPPSFTGFGLPVSTLLARRGFRDGAQLAAFLGAGAGALHDLSRMADADRALDRIDAALANEERIAIWGDYDADGMTAIVVWVTALRRLGHDPLRYVPSRVEEGYGLSAAGLQRLRDLGTRLVITCDCGVTNVAEVELARDIGLDVVVTDHHQPPTILPPAVAVVDPHRPDCAYPDPDLTGAGLSYKLAAALVARHGVSDEGLAAIAAIGTVADIAPMTGESRAIVRLGLEELARTERAGLRAILARSCDVPDQPTARDLAFGVVPRINAAGRIADTELAIALLLEEDPARAKALADELETVHERRREMTKAAVDTARAMVLGTSGISPLLLRDDTWAPGLVGLVAGRLSDALARPVGVATLVGEELRGSVRAPADFHVASALEACAAHLTKRGGHAGAGGFSLRPEGWAAFVEAFALLPRPFPADAAPEALRPGRQIVDLVLPARFLDWSLADELERLAPYGPGHLEPVLAVTGMWLTDARRVGSSEQHVAFRLRRGLETFDAVAFGLDAERPLPEPGDRIDLLGTLERDDFGGMPRLRLRVLDLAHADASPLGARRLAAMPAPPLAATA